MISAFFETHRTALRCLFVTLLLLPTLAGLCYCLAGALLSCPAESPHHVDVVVVLGGGDGARYARGRQLVLSGYSTHLLLSNPSASDREDVNKNLQGVDIRFDSWPKSTWQEAQAVRAWMQAYGWKSVLVVSDPPHLLRVEYSFASNFFGTGLVYTLIASNPPWWSAWRWWQNPWSKHFGFLFSLYVINNKL